MQAAMKCDRNSIGVEIDAGYCEMTAKRLKKHCRTLFAEANFEFVKALEGNPGVLMIEEEEPLTSEVGDAP